MPTAQNLPPNVNFASNANSCGRNTAANGMAGLGTAHTTLSSSTDSIFVSLTFKVASPATSAITTNRQVAYGTGAAPACNGASAGTTVGNQYTVASQAAVVGGEGQSAGITLVGLTPATTYWFDIRALDSTTDVWTYSNPAISVVELP